MKLLVSGAGGFTGRHFVAMAKSQGYEVQDLEADLLQPAALKEEVRHHEPDMVVHLAAISFVGHASAAAFYEVNVVGTLNLLDAIALLPRQPARVLLASSANVYGNCVSSPVSEKQMPAPVNHYAASKLSMEFLARTRAADLPIFFTRPFNYTGVGQSADFLIPKLVSHFAARADAVELGNLDVAREFNDVRYVCAAYLELLRHAAPGETYNICTGQAYTLHQVMNMLGLLTDHHVRAVVNPAFVRRQEIAKLEGDPGKLQHCIGKINSPSLEETLAWMLQAAASG